MTSRVLGYVMARNEWPLLGLAITHGFQCGLDHIVVVDHASTDGTALGLKRLQSQWPDRLTVMRLDLNAFHQELTTRAAMSVIDLDSYDWVYVFDADEFALIPENQSFGEMLTTIEPDVDALRYELLQWVAPHDMDETDPAHYLRIIERAVPCVFLHQSSVLLAERIQTGQINFFDLPFPSKIMVRNRFAHRLFAGAHTIVGDANALERTLPATTFGVGHIPLLGMNRLKLKSAQGRSNIDQGLPQWHGWQNQMIHHIDISGELSAYWERHSTHDVLHSDPRGSRPTTVPDERLRQCLSEAVRVFAHGVNTQCAATKPIEQPVVQLKLDQLVLDLHALTTQVDMLRAERDQLTGQSVLNKTEIARLSEEAERLSAQVHDLDVLLTEEQTKLSVLTRSNSWRVTLPLREARRWGGSPIAQAKRYTKFALGLAKRAYQRLPFNLQTKARHRRWIANLAPRILLVTGAHPSTVLASPAPQPLIRGISKEHKKFGHVIDSMKNFFKLLEIALKRGGGVKSTINKVFYLYRREGLTGISRRVAWSLEYQTSSLNRNSTAVSLDPEEVARDLFANQQAELTLSLAESRIAELAYQPLVSIIAPVYDTPLKWLRRMIESLQEQIYSNWELCVVDDSSPREDQRQLLSEMAKDDPRIRLAVMPSNSGISAASNLALGMARGEFVALVDHDDEITPDALFRMVEAINADTEADFLYSDECKICDTPARKLFHFVLKPDWSPEIMLNFMLTGHLTVYRTALVREIGGLRSAYDFSQDYDLALRMSEVSRKIIHVERILYLWRAIKGSAAANGKAFARSTNIAALGDALIRRQIPGTAEIEPQANRVRIALPEIGARVSIVIPSDSAKNLRLALNAIRDRTDYANYEIRVVCNSGVAAELEHDGTAWSAVKFVPYNKPFNFSDKCNAGAKTSEGDIVVFYNDDVYPISRDWIERLIEYLWIPGVGAVSPQLLYNDGSIQYAGMIAGTPGLVGTAYHKLLSDHCDPFLSLNRVVRNISVLSGACCAMRRDFFLQVGGFDPINTPDGHSDLDLSFKVLEEGFRCVYTPYALLTHVGNHSWNARPRKYKADIFCLKRWGRYVSRDPYFTPSMCKVLYRDFIFEYHIHAKRIDPAKDYSGPDVLFVSHEMTNTGAPLMLFEAAKAVKAASGFPVVVSPCDGPLRAAFEREGIVVIIDASATRHHFLFERFARNFDLAVVNTSILRDVVAQLATIQTLRTIWWLHESQMLAKNLADVPAQLWENVTAVCVSHYARSFMPENVPSHILFNGISDQSECTLPSPKIKAEGKLKFLLLGTVETRKGQDLFVDAILRVPEAMRTDCEFIMAGKLWPTNETFWERLAPIVASNPEIHYVGDLSHDDALALIAASDVLVCSSRDDACPLVCIEAMQLGKPLIVSDNVGIVEVINKDAAFVFLSGDVVELSECIKRAYTARGHLPVMGNAARRIYETQLTAEIFSINFLNLAYAQLNEDK